MSKIEFDFNNLKYNLYDILNVLPTSDETKIKKNFMKIIKTFHPDKNSELEEDIFHHIILSNQILLNKDSRQKYDDFLLNSAKTFNELKDNFNKMSQIPNQNIPKDSERLNLFNYKVNELNKKHGYDDNLENETTFNKFNKIKEIRKYDVNIDKEHFVNMDDFNKKFTSYKTQDGKFKNQIVEYKDQPNELSTYVIGEQYTSLADLDKLYIEDTIQCSKFSSLDRAFILQPTNSNYNNKTIDERVKEYQQQTDIFNKMNMSDYSIK